MNSLSQYPFSQDAIPGGPFAEIYKATRLTETADNYAVADQVDFAGSRNIQGASNNVIVNESKFWAASLKNPEMYIDLAFDLPSVTLSDWIPRVPGLFFRDNSLQLRQIADLSGVGYMPHMESVYVMGGFGTSRFPPDLSGNRIVSVTTSTSATCAIPAIIPNTVWNHLSLEPGDKLSLMKVTWRSMVGEWSQRFESVRGIPRAYLFIEDESQIRVVGKTNPPWYYPYTIMEHTVGNALHYDYVFGTVENNESSQWLSDWFERYLRNRVNNGRYLLNPDPTHPLFDTAYDSPEQLRRAESGGRYHLEILKEKIRGAYFNGRQIEEIIQLLSNSYADNDNIRRIATYLTFPAVQFASSRPADRISQLVDWCIDNPGKMEELIDKIIVEHPDLLTSRSF